MNLIEDIYMMLTDKHLLEMANMQPRETGLPAVIFISYKGIVKHGPRIKVSNVAGTFDPRDNFTMTIENYPRIIGRCKLKKSDVEDISDWILLNRDHLLKIWNHGGEMSLHDVAIGFKKI